MALQINLAGASTVCPQHKVANCIACIVVNKANLQPQLQSDTVKEWFTLPEIYEMAGRQFPFTVEWSVLNGFERHEIVNFDAKLDLWCVSDGRYFTSVTGITDKFRPIFEPIQYVVTYDWTDEKECTEKSCPDLLRNGHNEKCKYFKGVGNG